MVWGRVQVDFGVVTGLVQVVCGVVTGVAQVVCGVVQVVCAVVTGVVQVVCSVVTGVVQMVWCGDGGGADGLLLCNIMTFQCVGFVFTSSDGDEVDSS